MQKYNMNELDQYIHDSILLNKKPGGVKISNLKKKGYSRNYSNIELFCIAKNIGLPICPLCDEEPLKLKSFLSGEFSDYCSMSCYSNILSERNTCTNYELNAKIKSRNQEAHEIKKSNQMVLINRAINEYVSKDESHMKLLSKKYGVTYRYLKEELVKRDLLDKKRHRKVYKNNLSKKLKFQNEMLENVEWLQDKIDRNWSTSMVANEIGCSANYVAVKSKKIGLPFPNNKFVSSKEIILKELLEKEGYRVETNNREILNGREIDLVLPDHNIGIEVNGIFWHQFVEGSIFSKNNNINYHKNKTDDALKKGFFLMHIYDYEIDDPTTLEKFLHIIKSKTGKTKTIFARKCEIREIPPKDYKLFLENNHFKGSIPSKIKIGIYYEDELISCMGFSSPRFNKNYEWELIRLCTKQGMTITGGTKKMLSYFLKKYNPSSIISYCDRRMFSGDVYKKLGMNRINISNPNYQWVKYTGSGTVDILTRYQTQKHKISDNKTAGMTENEIMRNKGYMKIYDSGQDTWVLNCI